MARVLALLLSIFVAGALAATPEEDVQHYLQLFGGNTGHERGVEELAWKGISDERLYDLIEQRLLQDFQAARRDREARGRVARYIRALGFSGQAKYLNTILRFGDDPDYARYSKTAVAELSQYGRWNPVISNRATFDPNLSDDDNRVVNMLRSDDPLLQRVGAKCVFFRDHSAVVVDLLAEMVRERYRTSDPVNVDTYAWMVKGLGRAGRDRYRDLLEDIRANAPDRALRNQAAGALR